MYEHLNTPNDVRSLLSPVSCRILDMMCPETTDTIEINMISTLVVQQNI